MREPDRAGPRPPAAILRVRDLHVFYGQSHALQGVELTLETGILSLVGRNGMGKTTLCKAILGLIKSARGSIMFERTELTGLSSSDIANLGIGYVPQGRRLWRSLTVEEHLRLSWRGERSSAWTIERVYDTFARLAERRNHGAAQLSGGEQQMLAIARALLGNPRLLVMDEPTEGLAPLIVRQIEELLLTLAEEEDIAILLVEQNLGVASAISEQVAIMVNGRINRIMDAMALAADRDLQQRLLGVGRHAHDDTPEAVPPADAQFAAAGSAQQRPRLAALRRRRAFLGNTEAVEAGAVVYMANLAAPTKWSQPAMHPELLRAASPHESRGQLGAKLGLRGPAEVLVAGTFDTKARELRFLRDCLLRHGLRVRCVDLSTSGKPSGADVPPNQVAAYHRRGQSAVFTGDRGEAVREMANAFANWIARQPAIAGIISAGGSGGTALATPAMRRLAIGIPKVMISTVAAGDVRGYVGGSDIMMLHSVTDVQGLNRVSRQVLANGANALAGMVAHAAAGANAGTGRPRPTPPERPAIGLTMFGVTTPCVQKVASLLEQEFECLVFHATGVGGQSMEQLVDSAMLSGVIDITTTEVADLLFGGVLPASQDRFGAVVRTRIPYVGSCGALDMINFGPFETVPERCRGRNLYRHNPQVTLMRTTAEENQQMARFIGGKLNRMEGPVRFFLPEGGFSLIDAPGKPFYDPVADAAFCTTLEATVRQTGKRQLIRSPFNINDPRFAEALTAAFVALGGRRPLRRGSGQR